MTKRENDIEKGMEKRNEKDELKKRDPDET
jgi:hypothetical protein